MKKFIRELELPIADAALVTTAIGSPLGLVDIDTQNPDVRVNVRFLER